MNAPKLELRHGQSLVMTQSLQQSIKLLQYNSLELREFVEHELEENPFLIQEEGEINELPGPSADTAPDNDGGEPREADFDNNEDFSGNMQADEGWDEQSGDDWGDDWASIETDYLRYDQGSSGNTSGYDTQDDTRSIEDNPSSAISLREHLLNQLQVEVHDAAKRLIGAHLIDMVDDAGYIKDDLAPLCGIFGVEIGEIEAVLALLQGFDPVGICSRNLSECLALQLVEKNRLDPAMQKLLAHLNLLADSRFDELQKKCGVDKEDLRQMIAEIRQLNPKPGSGFVHEISQMLEPDIFVRRRPDGNWHVELNMNNFPRIMVNKRFYKKITGETRNKKDKEYLSEQFGSANWLIRALEQRAQTMLKVAGELVKQQDAFFRLGVRYMKPMTLKDIAAETGYHESTISRVTNGKYLLCPRGTFELKYFFTSSITRSDGGGDDFSSQTIKHLITEVIEKESIDNVLLDDNIVDLLKERNITIARRTVAKYRKELGISSSPKRKRMKQNTL